MHTKNLIDSSQKREHFPESVLDAANIFMSKRKRINCIEVCRTIKRTLAKRNSGTLPTS